MRPTSPPPGRSRGPKASLLPPGGNGTTSVLGRVGLDCATAPCAPGRPHYRLPAPGMHAGVWARLSCSVLPNFRSIELGVHAKPGSREPAGALWPGPFAGSVRAHAAVERLIGHRCRIHSLAEPRGAPPGSQSAAGGQGANAATPILGPPESAPTRLAKRFQHAPPRCDCHRGRNWCHSLSSRHNIDGVV